MTPDLDRGKAELHFDNTQQSPAIGRPERPIRRVAAASWCAERRRVSLRLGGAVEQVGHGEPRLIEVMTTPGPMPLDEAL